VAQYFAGRAVQGTKAASAHDSVSKTRNNFFTVAETGNWFTASIHFPLWTAVVANSCGVDLSLVLGLTGFIWRRSLLLQVGY
jgi:hypothetical protein